MTPFTCESARRLVIAYVDGELVGDEREFFEVHVERCDACRHAIRDEVALGHALDRALPQDRAPADLRARVEALFELPSLPQGSSRRWALGWAAVLTLTSVVGGYALGRMGRVAPSPVVAAAAPTTTTLSEDLAALAADTHLRYVRGQLPLEIDSARPEKVSHWFSGRVPFNLALPDYPVGPGEQKFYRLEGGRLVAFGGDYAAYVAYRMDEHPISLIVTSAAQAHPEGGDVVKFRTLEFHQKAVQGLKVITWTDKGLTYALASDLSLRNEQSCMVCHGSPQDRPLIEGFSEKPRS
jgi:anti-sigma factor RsiW